MGRTASLIFRAGRGAYEDIRARGFAPERIGTIAGASGGAKWLVLSQLDRVIVEQILPRLTGPVHLVGSSIGAWRFACYAQSAPREALERFEAAYLEQSYTARPTAAEISTKSRDMLRHVLGTNGVREILSHPQLRTHVLAVRARGLTASESRPVLALGLAAAATANAVSRRGLAAFFERGLFYDARDLPPFYNAPGFPLHRIELTEANLTDAIVASGSIPMVLSGVHDIPGAPPGVYRDGGIIDYHLDLPLGEPDRITLFPHFFDRLVPGWFDKRLHWRRHRPVNIDRVLLVCPSAGFVAGLPYGRIPDRADFLRLTAAERAGAWRQVVAACTRLAEEFTKVLEEDRLPELVKPL